MTGCLTHLARLERDNAGNTLAIAAASLIPLMALIGGGVTYGIGDDVQLDAAIHFGLSEDADDVAARVGVSFRI